jgi:hypothetical protein
MGIRPISICPTEAVQHLLLAAPIYDENCTTLLARSRSRAPESGQDEDRFHADILLRCEVSECYGDISPATLRVV